MNEGSAIEAKALLLIPVLALTLVFLALPRERLKASTRRFVLVVLALASGLAYLQPLHYDSERGVLRWSIHGLHPSDFFHYYVGAKYFPELGYHGIYDATVIADFEDRALWRSKSRRFKRRAPIRDLATNRVDRSRARVLEDSERIRAPFTQQRWAEFVRDVAYFRGRAPGLWASGRLHIDHGYNGSPLTTLLLGSIVRLPVSIESFVLAARLLDLALVIGLGVAVARVLGLEVGLLFAVFFAANPLNDFGYIGMSFLRYDYLVALGAALLLWRAPSGSAAGSLIAASTLLRGFPAVFALSRGLGDLVPGDRWARLKERRGFYLGGVAATLVLLAATWFQTGPDGQRAWPSFVSRVIEHAGNPAPNRVGLRAVFQYSSAHELADVARASADSPFGTPRDWAREATRTFEGRRFAFWGSLLAISGALVWRLRRDASVTVVLLAAYPLVFTLFSLAHYYYAVLSLVPIVVHNDRRLLMLTTAAFLVIAALMEIDALVASRDRLFLAVSCVVALLCVALVSVPPRSSQDDASGAAL